MDDLSPRRSSSPSGTLTLTTRIEPAARTVDNDDDAMWVRETRSQAIKLALAGYKKLKDSRSGVLFLKGGLAISQITCLVVLLILAHYQVSPIIPGVTQSAVPSSACGKPLDKWIIASIIRLAVCWNVSIWVVCRKKEETDEQGAETGQLPNANTASESTRPSMRQDRQSSSTTVVPMLYKDSRGTHVDDVRAARGKSERKASYPDEDEHRERGQLQEEERGSAWTRLARRLDWAAPKISMSLGLLSLALFIYGNVLLFTSLDTCRRSAPLLWWAVMVVVGVGWFLLLEVVMVVLVVGVVGPGILVLLRRFGFVAPLPEPALPFPLPPKPMDTAEIEGLGRVAYLAALPGQADESLEAAERDDLLENEKPAKRTFFQRKAERKVVPRTKRLVVRPRRVEGYALPVIRLAREMASCSICLVDFVEGSRTADRDTEESESEHALRLLECGHVFHVECIDQWLTSASARCPVCSAPVVLPKPVEQAVTTTRYHDSKD